MMTPGNIIVVVSEYFRVPIGMVLSTCRDWEFVKVRQVSMYFMKLYVKKISLQRIGNNFPGKSGYTKHCTVLHGIKKVKGYIDTNKAFKNDILILDKKITELYSVTSTFKHIETETEKFERLWAERERILISENKHLKEEIAGLKKELSKLQGVIYGLKLSKRKVKREYLKSKLTIEPLKEKVSPNHEYHGYKEHSL